MCRFTLYLGPPVRMSTLLTEPQHSLIRQSFDSKERSEPLNGDGFGVGWYSPRLHPQPAQLHEITPAWNNQNLESISRVVASPCIMAHVRAASPGSLVNEANCHHFGYENFLMMHNGDIGGFQRVRRSIMDSLQDTAFNVIRGSTDTEHLFATFVDEVNKQQESRKRNAEASEPITGLDLARNLSTAITRVLKITQAQEDWQPSHLNIAVADGSHVAVCRFSDAQNEKPLSLHLLHGELYPPISRHFQDKQNEAEEAMIVSSEPLNKDPRWQDVPPNTMLVLDRRKAPMQIPMKMDGSLEWQE